MQFINTVTFGFFLLFAQALIFGVSLRFGTFYRDKIENLTLEYTQIVNNVALEYFCSTSLYIQSGGV